MADQSESRALKFGKNFMPHYIQGTWLLKLTNLHRYISYCLPSNGGPCYQIMRSEKLNNPEHVASLQARKKKNGKMCIGLIHILLGKGMPQAIQGRKLCRKFEFVNVL